MDAGTLAPRGSPILEKEIVVVYGIDNRFALPLAASLQSALDHLGPGYRLDVHVIDGGLTGHNRTRLVRSFADRPCRLTWLRPEHRELANLKVGGAITTATYYRLLIPELLATHRKAIYLDADLIVQADLADLWNAPLGDHHLLAVQDQGVQVISGPFGLTNYRSLGIPDGRKYFNAGVLVLALDRWRADRTAEAIVNYVREKHEYIRFHDQDGLNAVLWDSWGELDPRWNQMPQSLQFRNAAESPFDPDTLRRLREAPYIVHYASADKPWRFGCRHPATARFFAYVDRTEFRGFRPSQWRSQISDLVNFVQKRVVRVSRSMHVGRDRVVARVGEPMSSVRRSFEALVTAGDRWLRRTPATQGDRRTGAPTYPPDFSAEDIDTIRAVSPYTMTSAEKIYELVRAVEYVVRAGIPGAVVECGVWKGGSMMAVARTLVRLGDVSRSLYLFDTFEGMTPPQDVDRSYRGESAAALLAAEDPNASWVWAKGPLDEVKEALAQTSYPAERVSYIKGKVEETLPEAAPDRIALLRLDTDWYSSTYHELVHLYPRLVPGGVIIFDDYGHWEGARRAVDQYFAEQNISIFLHRIDYAGRLALKPR